MQHIADKNRQRVQLAMEQCFAANLRKVKVA